MINTPSVLIGFNRVKKEAMKCGRALSLKLD